VHVLDMDGEEIGNIRATENKTCPTGLAFAHDSSFFILSGSYVDENENTELIAYNSTNLNRIWGSRTITGSSPGSPIVSTDGLYTYIVTNSMKNTRGNFIIIDNTDGSTVFSEEKSVSYAPLGVGRNVERGNWRQGAHNRNDMLVWGELYRKDQGKEDDRGVTWFDGSIHFFQLPSEFDRDDTASPIRSGTGNQIRKTTLSAPVVRKDGLGAYFSFHAGQMRGWSIGHFFGRTPSIKFQLDKEFDNSSPGPNGGNLVYDDKVYLVAGPPGVPYLYAYQLFENRTDPFHSSGATQLWKIRTSALVVAQVKTAFEDRLAYYIESEGGDLVCVETLSGLEQWRHPSGHNTVADFAIVDDEFLIFSTTNGYTSLVRIGNRQNITSSMTPTKSTSLVPSIPPTKAPSIQPTVPSKDYNHYPSIKPVTSTTKPPSSSQSKRLTSFPTPSGTDAPTINDTYGPSNEQVEMRSTFFESSSHYTKTAWHFTILSIMTIFMMV